MTDAPLSSAPLLLILPLIGFAFTAAFGRRLGGDGATTHVEPSPFDIEANARLYVPADIVGTRVYDPSSGFRVERGPVFTNILLADEINRASPRTQSALLEVMEERTVTIDGEGTDNLILTDTWTVTGSPVLLNGVAFQKYTNGNLSAWIRYASTKLEPKKEDLCSVVEK